MVWAGVQVAFGGAVGSTLRWLLGLGVQRLTGGSAFPLGVLTANVIGSFAMGALIIWAGRTGHGHLNPLLATGMLGGFTTFSAFSLETVTLYERGEIAGAAFYVIASVTVSIAALLLGVALMRAALP